MTDIASHVASIRHSSFDVDVVFLLRDRHGLWPFMMLSSVLIPYYTAVGT